MPWLPLLADVRAWLIVALVSLGIYAATQNIEKVHAQAELAQFKADVESEAAKAKVRAAQEVASQAQHAQEVLSDLQTRLDRANARYRSLRDNPGSSPVPALSTAAPSISSCPDGGDSTARFLAEVESRVTAITEIGDREIAKYKELWELQQKNSRLPL